MIFLIYATRAVAGRRVRTLPIHSFFFASCLPAIVFMKPSTPPMSPNEKLAYRYATALVETPGITLVVSSEEEDKTQFFNSLVCDRLRQLLILPNEEFGIYTNGDSLILYRPGHEQSIIEYRKVFSAYPMSLLSISYPPSSSAKVRRVCGTDSSEMA